MKFVFQLIAIIFKFPILGKLSTDGDLLLNELLLSLTLWLLPAIFLSFGEKKIFQKELFPEF